MDLENQYIIMMFQCNFISKISGLHLEIIIIILIIIIIIILIIIIIIIIIIMTI